jgi:hypothetical protein
MNRFIELHDWIAQGRRSSRISIGESGAATVELYDDGVLVAMKSHTRVEQALDAALTTALAWDMMAPTMRCPSAWLEAS